MMYKAKWCRENLVSSDYEWNYVTGEIKELLIEIKKLNFKGVVEEFQDVVFGLNCKLYTSYGINLPVFTKSVDKILERFKVWENIFKEHELIFDKKYLLNGANYNKEHKVYLALEMARKEQK